MKVKYSDLKNKRVFITGGGSGIGASIVEHFCEQGSEVYFVDIDLKETKKLLNKSISENLDLAKSINKKLSNRNVDKEKSIKKLQTEMLNSQKAEKYINPSDIENLKKQL